MALQAVWELTAGQPWLVNALAQDACFADAAAHDPAWYVDADVTVAT